MSAEQKMRHLPLTVGLTGGIASGKSTVSELFAQLGIPVLDADQLAHALVHPGQPALDEIIAQFGKEFLTADGELHRAKLREMVFSDSSQRLRLEAILHPRILQRMQQDIAKLCDFPYCILSIPLLLEKNQQYTLERVLVVDCPLPLQIQRLKSRSQLSDELSAQILAAQLDRDTRLSLADEVIDNQYGPDHLIPQVLALDRFYRQLRDTLHLSTLP